MSTPQTLMILGGIIVAVLVVMFLSKRKEAESPIPEKDVSEDESELLDSIENEIRESKKPVKPEVIRTINPTSTPKTVKPAKRKIRPVRSRPSRNNHYRSRYGYNEGLTIEDILFYMWLLDDFHVDYDEDFEFEVEGVEGVSLVENVGGTLTFKNDSGEVVMGGQREDGMFNVTDGDLSNMSYSVNPETGEIEIQMNDEVQVVSYSDGEWANQEPESPSDTSMDEELSVDEVVAASAVYSESVNTAESFVVESSGSDDTSSSDNSDTSSSVDSDTSY